MTKIRCAAPAAPMGSGPNFAVLEAFDYLVGIGELDCDLLAHLIRFEQSRSIAIIADSLKPLSHFEKVKCIIEVYRSC